MPNLYGSGGASHPIPVPFAPSNLYLPAKDGRSVTTRSLPARSRPMLTSATPISPASAVRAAA